MKKILLIIMAAIFSLSAVAQSKDLSKMETKQRETYLVKIAKEVTDTFGPGWYQGGIIPEISGPKIYDDKRPEVQKHIGRKYYTIKFWYDDKTKKKTGGWRYASEVEIWEDDGEPMGILFGDSYGFSFLMIPYRSMKKSGINKEYQIPFRKLEVIRTKDGGFIVD